MTAGETRPGAMWVWAPIEPAAVVDLAAARGVGDLFVEAPPNFSTDPRRDPVIDLVGRARQRGVRVQALGGEATWLADPALAIRGWLRPLLESGLFDGVHLDIEPPGLGDDRDGQIARPFSALVGAIATAAGATPVEIDVGHWYHRVPLDGGNLAAALLAAVDAATILAYRNVTDGPNGSIAIAGPVSALAVAAGRPWRVGQDTTDTDPDHRTTSFHGRPASELAAARARLDAHFAVHPGYLGTAVHDAHGWRRLR